MSSPDPACLNRRLLLAGPAALAFAPAPATSADTPARYRVRLLSVSPPRFAVEAVLPGATDRLTMGRSYPAELPEMARQGWPALVADLAAEDAAGALPLTPERNGWNLGRPAQGPVRLGYVADFGLFESAGWSSPLESAAADGEALSVSGRGLFIASGERPAAVDFELPRPWRSAVPWLARGREAYAVDGLQRLQDNLLAFSTGAPLAVGAAGFTLRVTPMGHWRPLAGEVREALARIVRREVELVGWRGREAFNVVLVPTDDMGGEAYRQSLAIGFRAPSAANRPDWANFLAHEVFHYWNASRLRGADYASTQWFQEGFTEYVANLSVLSTGVADLGWFLGKLTRHVENAARLETTLENIGSRKGPPLYSAGALVAFAWDTALRRGTGGRRDIGSVFRNLWLVTDDARRPYAWPDIRRALDLTAPGDWEGFHRRFIAGTEKPDHARVFADAGLRLEDGAVSVNPAAAPEAQAVLRSLQR